MRGEQNNKVHFTSIYMTASLKQNGHKTQHGKKVISGKEYVEDADLYESVINKKMTTLE